MLTILNKNFRWAFRLLVLIFLVICLVPVQQSRAAGPWYVTPQGNDSSTCLDSAHPCATIQAAIDKATSGDAIYVAIGIYRGNTESGVITLNEKDLDLSGGWSANFAAQSGKSTIDGEHARRGVKVFSGIVTIENFIIENGYAFEWGNLQQGGGIFHNQGTLILTNVIIRNCQGDSGGGIVNFGVVDDPGILTIDHGWIDGNTAGDARASDHFGGGGIRTGGTLTLINSAVTNNIVLGNSPGAGIESWDTLIMDNSTISGNRSTITLTDNFAVMSYGQIFLSNATIANNLVGGLSNNGNMQSQNSILADNTVVDCWDRNFPITGASLGYNLIDGNLNCNINATDLTNVDAKVGSLRDNGGQTLTHALLPGSPAINGGNPAGCTGSTGLLSSDQRSLARNGRCDIGSYEVQTPSSRVFLPFMSRGRNNMPGLYGHVTLHGTSAPGVYLELNLFNGSSWSIAGYAFTDANGDYGILPPRDLYPGELYCVVFMNDSEEYDGRLILWLTRALASYSAGENVNIGDFDLADTLLVRPGGFYSSLPLPGKFIWDKRAGMQGDDYQVDVFEPADSLDLLSPRLGFTRSFTLNNIPAGFFQNVTYHWEVITNSLDGGLGVSYYVNDLNFYYPYGSVSGMKVSEPHPNSVSLTEMLNRRGLP